MSINCIRLFAAIGLMWLVNGRAVAETEPVEAIWHSQQVNLRYPAERTQYSCADLVRRVAKILLELGARADGSLRLSCTPGLMAQQGLEISIATPVEATAENVLAASTHSGTDRLIAQLRGEHLPAANDIARFPATWRSISLTSAGGLRLGSGDCELIRGLKDQVFPRLSVRVAEGFRCNADSAMIRPRVTVEALVPLASR